MGQLPDPRDPRGVRPAFTAILGIAVCAVLAGARSFISIAEWSADSPRPVRVRLGVPPTGYCVPGGGTVRAAQGAAGHGAAVAAPKTVCYNLVDAAGDAKGLVITDPAPMPTSAKTLDVLSAYLDSNAKMLTAVVSTDRSGRDGYRVPRWVGRTTSTSPQRVSTSI